MKSSRRTEKGNEKKTRITLTTSRSVPTRKPAKKTPSTLALRFKKHSKIALRSTLLSPVFQKSVKMLAVTVFVSMTLYGVYQLVGKTFANEVVISKSEIVSRVAKLTPLPAESPDDVVRVEDEMDLKKQNEFYKDVKEGDYILMYREMAVIYDLRNNSIVAMRRTLNEGREGVSRTEKSSGMSPKEVNQALVRTSDER